MTRKDFTLYTFIIILFFIISYTKIYGVEKSTLIDFNRYEQILTEEFPSTVLTNMLQLEIKFPITAEDYYIDNWRVVLNESARNLSVENNALSYVKKITNVNIREFGFENATILGARIHFPVGNFPSYALIKPLYPIPIFKTNGNFANVGNGVITNVNEIIKLGILVDGRNYNYGIAVRLLDRDQKVHEYFLGYLFFKGWRKLYWENMNFISDYRLKTVKRQPLYPRPVPYYALDSIVIYKPPFEKGGDFVVYVANIDIEYTPFFVEPPNGIDDESIWKILTEELLRRARIFENRRIEQTELMIEERKRLQPYRPIERTQQGE